MTAQTPLYGIKYPVVGEPIRTTRQILEDNAKAIEAALASVPLAPPGTTDLAAALVRVATLEHINDPVTDLTLAAGVNNLTPTYRKAGVYRVGRAICLTSVVQVATTGALGTGATVGTLPTGMRPATTVPLFVNAQTSALAQTAIRVDATASGALAATNGIPAGTYLFLDSVQFPGA